MVIPSWSARWRFSVPIRRRLEEIARRAGVPTSYVDMCSIALSPHAFVEAMGEGRVVIAGRDPPAAAWREDPG